jgi:hypothetical protein
VVREDPRDYPPHGAYEAEGSERRALGSISVGARARWQGELTVPMHNRGVLFLQIDRDGELPDGYRGAEEWAFFSMPIDEADAVVDLLAGLVAQARRDGLLP